MKSTKKLYQINVTANVTYFLETYTQGEAEASQDEADNVDPYTHGRFEWGRATAKQLSEKDAELVPRNQIVRIVRPGLLKRWFSKA